MRRLTAFPCADATLIGTLDERPGPVGLLIVSGGDEVRGGAHRGMAQLAARLDASVLRFDRRGVGDSTGANRGFRSSGPDIAAAADALRCEAGVARIVGFGNCDAASALALFGRAAGLDALVLANPWLAATGDLPPPAAIRARYVERLRQPETWRRALHGQLSFTLFFKGLRAISRAAPQNSDILPAIAGWGDDATVILAERDATAIGYAAAARRAAMPPPAVVVPTDAHSFARPGDMAPVEDAIVATIRRLR